MSGKPIEGGGYRMQNASMNHKTIAPEDVGVFCEQIALMLSAGMSLGDGLSALYENYHGTPEEKIYAALCEKVDETGSLYDGLKAAGRFPPYMVEMTQIGERTGKLEQVMNGLCAYYRSESRIRRAITHAVAYPIVLGVMMTCVIVVLITKVLPIFDQVLGSMGMEMNRAGMALLQFGMNTGKIVLSLVGVLVLLVLCLCLLLRTKWRERALRFVRRALPPIDRLNRRLTAARFSSVMAMMLDSGFPMEEALGVMPAILTDEKSRALLLHMNQAVGSGVPLIDALSQTGLFDALHLRMIRLGFIAGQSDSVMRKVAEVYAEEVENGIDALVSVIEPSLVALLSVVIGAILLSVMLPMAGIISSMM